MEQARIQAQLQLLLRFEFRAYAEFRASSRSRASIFTIAAPTRNSFSQWFSVAYPLDMLALGDLKPLLMLRPKLPISFEIMSVPLGAFLCYFHVQSLDALR